MRRWSGRHRFSVASLSNPGGWGQIIQEGLRQTTLFLNITVMLVFNGYFTAGISSMSSSIFNLLGGRLSVDFVNISPPSFDVSWERLIQFLNATKIVSDERAAQLVALPQVDPQAADALLSKSKHLGVALRKAFTAMLRKQRIAGEWIEPINEILRITEGHDELVGQDTDWRIEFVAREGGLDWLLAAIARSGAETIAEGVHSRIRICANPHCGLFFYDDSRTHGRRWCSMAVCGNRNKVATFARKHAAARAGG